MKFLLATLLLSALCISNSSGQVIQGKVVGVTDGDTFTLLDKDSVLIKVRLANIDCPEKKQPYSDKATQFTSDAIFGEMITIKKLKSDRYRRYIAIVFYGDSINLNQQLVKNGLAWDYVKYSKDTLLKEYQKNARLMKLGLWRDKNPIAPWDWRDKKTKK
ncbi:MAG: thermonuclease family protein [Flavobacteriaceae bacterium]|nr:thermonuclease family protein [Flavobacteriaceae bacterium]